MSPFSVVAPRLFDRCSLEVTGKSVGEISASVSSLPSGTPINIAFLGNETHEQRVRAAEAVREHGFEPVPIIAARRLKSPRDLDVLLSRFQAVACPVRYLFVGGDPILAAGPYKDAVQLLESGILTAYGIRNVGVVAYPEGHPRISHEQLWDDLRRKLDIVGSANCSIEVTTQFGIDPDAVLAWLLRARAAHINIPVRIGVPGPASLERLRRFALQFGAAISDESAVTYGFGKDTHDRKIGAELFLDRLFRRTGSFDLGRLSLHLYPFGGIRDTISWISGCTTNQANVENCM